MGALDLAPRIFAIVRALVENPGAAVTDALRSLTSAAADEFTRIQHEAERIVQGATAEAQRLEQTARGAVADAQQELAATTAAFGSRLADAQAAVAGAIEDGERTLSAAQQQADRVRAGAVAAAVDPAERAAIEARAQQLITDAQSGVDAARQRAEAVVAAVTAEVEELRTKLDASIAALDAEASAAAARATQIIAEAQQRIGDEVARLTAAAQQAIATVTAVPGKAVALAEDARNAIANAVEDTASLIGLITQGLVYLKNELFGDVENLHVVSYTEPTAPQPGIGLSWVDGDSKVLVAYVPEMGGPLGSLVIEAARPDGAPFDVSATHLIGPVAVRIGVAASGNQSTIISFAAPAPPTADGALSLFVEFATSALSIDQRFIQAAPGTPRIELALSSKNGAWHYRVDGGLSGAHWGVDFARLLDPIPNLLPVPGIGETRGFGMRLEDGVFSFTEVNAA